MHIRSEMRALTKDADARRVEVESKPETIRIERTYPESNGFN